MQRFYAKTMTMFFRFWADIFFRERYGHRAVVLETIAGVPGMVAGMLIHMKSLRQHKRGYGPQIRELLSEAENERMHLMFFIEITKPNWFERLLIIGAQFVFVIFYLISYLLLPKTSHLMIHHFEEEAVKSYTNYLGEIASGRIEDVPAPQIAIDYYELKPDARLSDMIVKIKQDEAKHSDVNYRYAYA